MGQFNENIKRTIKNSKQFAINCYYILVVHGGRKDVKNYGDKGEASLMKGA